jgi:hypothetical protein
VNILLLYDNFIRDYRGLLLLQEYLRKLGHKVWIKAGWDDPFTFSGTHKIQAIVTGQVAEWATHKFAKYCEENKILLIINTSEPITAEYNFKLLVTYNTHEWNDEMIDLQTIGIAPHYRFVQENTEINEKNKNKYKFLGFPRTDISYHVGLRDVEKEKLISKYDLQKYKKVYLFLSSFLLDKAFDGVPEQDLKKWNFTEFQQRTKDLLAHTSETLRRFIAEYVKEGEVLLIKKHPWDCSSFFADNFLSEKCLILENNEFITTCLSVSDCIIHTYSTAAIEAWVMKKRTVALYLKEYVYAMPLHMNKEKIAYDYPSLVTILNSPVTIPDYNDEELFSGKLDGKATERFAREIHKLEPKKRFSMLSRFASKKKESKESQKKYDDLDTGKFLYEVDKLAEKNTKYHDFLAWENHRHKVNKLYKGTIKQFVKKHFKG